MKTIVCLCCFALVMACGEPVIKKPENLIARDTMVDLLYDLSIIHAAKGINPQLLEDGEIGTMDYLFKKYEVDSMQFVSSDTYYASLPSVYESIYQEVVDRLDSTKLIIEAERKRVNDSVKKAKELKKSVFKPDSLRRIAVDSLP